MADIDKFIYYDNGSKKVLKPTDRIVIGSGGLAFEGSTNDDFEVLLAVEDPTADRTITFPDEDGDIALLQGDSLPKALSFPVKNPSTTTALTKGQIVYISGHSGNKPEVSLAQSNSSVTMPAFGFVQSDIAAEAEGYVVYSGLFKGIDTNTSYSEGDTLYVSSTSAGDFQNTPPAGSNLIQNVGKIIKSDSSNGELLVGGAGRTNATPNLNEGHIFLGNANNQSVESAYQLPLTVGTSGQVLTSNGTNVTFQDSSGGGISNVVEDTTPQLGGNLDPNSFGISGHLLPSAVDTYDLGGTSGEWRNLYLGDYSSIYFGNDIETQLSHIPDTGLFLYIGSGTGLAVDRPDFSLYNAANVTSGPVFDLKKSSTHIAVNDTVGKIQMSAGGTISPSTDIVYSEISTGVLAKDASSEEGSLKIKVAASGTLTTGITIEPQNSGSNASVKISDAYYLPTSDGTSNQILQTDGSGNLSFADVSGGISNVVEDTTPQLGGNLDPNGFGISNHLLPSGANTYSLGSNALEWSDLYLGDFSVIYFGSDQDTKLTHVHNSGLKFELDSAGSNEPKFEFISNNAGNIGPSLSMFHDSSSPAVNDIFSTIEFKTNNDADQAHVVCKIQAIASNVTDASESSEFRFINSNNGASFTSGNVVFTSDGIVKSRGGFGTLVDNLSLKFGIDEEITLTHVHNSGVNFKNESTSSGTNFNLTLQSNSTSVSSGNVISSLNFQAPNESSGSDAVLVCAGIEAVAESSFTSTNNSTKLSFKTSSSESASEKMSLSSEGKLSVHGATALKIQASDPSIETDFAHIYAKDVASSAELFVQDEAGNVTQISPHNEEGDWIYWSENIKTGKKVKVNMEKMIKRLEVITGETFFEEYTKES